ncbi:hypothetical protein LguiA_009006 [Lonicera macranthoides]
MDSDTVMCQKVVGRVQRGIVARHSGIVARQTAEVMGSDTVMCQKVAFVLPAAISTVKKLSQNSLGHALELVMKAKSSVTNECVRSVADLMDVDFGWGKAVYGGLAMGQVGDIPGFINFYMEFRNNKGENVAVVPICLPATAMERSVKVLGSMLAGNDQLVNATASSQKSAL